MHLDFGKTAKRFIIASLLIVVLGGIAVGVTYRTQIQELISCHQAFEVGANLETKEAQSPAAENNQVITGNDNKVHEHEHGGFFRSAQITEPSTGAKIVLGVYGLLCLLIGVSYWLLVAIWLYQAAEKSFRGGLMWLVLGIVFNLAAALAFVLFCSFKSVCPNCGLHQNASEYCRFCGAAMKRKCGVCGTVVNIHDKYCFHCGKSLTESPDKIK